MRLMFVPVFLPKPNCKPVAFIFKNTFSQFLYYMYCLQGNSAVHH